MATYADILKKKAKEWDCPEMLDSKLRARGSKLPFSSPMLNYATYGGIPRDKMTEFFGDPGGGKSTTAIDICKMACQIFKEEWEAEIAKLQAKLASGDKTVAAKLEDLQEMGPKKVIYYDLEHSFDDYWAQVLGIEPGTIDIIQPPDLPAEEILQMLQELIETGEVGLAVLDSIPSLVPRAELEKKYGERTVSALAGLLTVFCRKITPMLTRYNCTLLCINQIRDNMDNPYVINTPGGKALKFYCSLRILFKIGTPIDFLGNELPASTENPAGYVINAKLVKQKSAPWDRRNASYYLMVQSGIRNDIDMAQLAVKKYNIIVKSGAWFALTIPGTGEAILDSDGKPIRLNGMSKVLEYLQQHPDYYKQIEEFILHDIEGRGSEEQGSESDGLV